MCSLLQLSKKKREEGEKVGEKPQSMMERSWVFKGGRLNPLGPATY